MLRMRTLPAGFIVPCLPTKTDKLPSGDGWLHEIKHDSFRPAPARNAGNAGRGEEMAAGTPLVSIAAIFARVDL